VLSAVANAEPLAQTIATQVGASNNVGGRLLKTTEVTVTLQRHRVIICDQSAGNRAGAKNRYTYILCTHLGKDAGHGGCVSHGGSLQSFWRGRRAIRSCPYLWIPGEIPASRIFNQDLWHRLTERR
jgi:hypothetical protein